MNDTEPSSGTVDHGPPQVTPNPLGTGTIKLTMPARRGRARDAALDLPDPGPDEDQQQAPDGHDDPDAAVPDPDAPATTDAAEKDSDALPYSPDRRVLGVFGVLVVVVIAIAAVVWWFSLPTPPAKPVHTLASPQAAAAPAPVSAAPLPQDGPLPMVTSAVCPGQTDPKLATSTDKHSGWVCPTGGVPFGQKLTATLPQPYVITGLSWWPGGEFVGPDGRDEWFRHRIEQEVDCVFNDRDLTKVTGTPNGERHEYRLAVHVVASQVECTVTASVPPPPQPPTTPTSAPPGADPSAADTPPDLSSIFPAAPTDTSGAGNDPNGSSIAVTGFQLTGHPIS